MRTTPGKPSAGTGADHGCDAMHASADRPHGEVKLRRRSGSTNRDIDCRMRSSA